MHTDIMNTDDGGDVHTNGVARHVDCEEIGDRKRIRTCGGDAHEDTVDPVVITGYAFRFPGGLSTPEKYWEVLMSQRCVIEEISTRWSLDRFYSTTDRLPGHFNTRYFGFVNNSDAFDPAFFNISAADAEAMDPQQRVFLMCVVEALERSCIPIDSLKGSNTGVWVGASVMDYLAVSAGAPWLFNAHSNPGMCLCVIANRVSLFLGARGPSMAVDTACASALTTLDLAWRALSDGRCDTAIFGATNAVMLPEVTVGYTQMGVLAKDGRCKTFDARADGFARGEGYGCLVIKRMSHATRDGNPILAVVRGSECNANGDQTTGLTKPSLGGQADLIKETWLRAGMDMADVDYVETHGTGTSVGDPIEANAVGSTLGAARKARGLPPLPICSNKANLGHMESSAALGSLVKACLMIQHRTLIPQALFEKPNPEIDWQGGHVCVLRKPMPARPDAPGHPLTIAINAFGFGGANSHVILQAPPAISNTRQDHLQTRAAGWKFGVPGGVGKDVFVVLTAASADALRQLAGRWEGYASPQHDAMNVAATAATTRSLLTHRVVLMAASAEEFRERALKFASGGEEDGVAIVGKAGTVAPRVCFVFSGQGPQHAEMGRALFATQAVFRELVQQCDQVFASLAGYSFLERTGLFTAGKTCTVDMDRPDTAQPAICFFQMGVYALLVSWNVKPAVVVGHSVGEVAAAWAAGRITLAHTVRLIYVRSQQQQRTEGQGGMVAVAGGRARVEAVLRARGLDQLAVAAVNSPSSVTVAGEPGQIKELRRLCKEVYGLQSAVLGVRCAYHTAQMNPIREGLLSGLSFLDHTGPARVASADMGKSAKVIQVASASNESTHPPVLFSTVSGDLVPSEAKLGSDYWWHNVREEVRFQKAVEAIAGHSSLSPDLVIEISCRPVLGSLLRQAMGAKAAGVVVTSTAERAFSAERQVVAAAATAFVRGAPVQWPALLGPPSPISDLPIYPFREERFMRMAPAYRRLLAGQVRDPFLECGMHISVDQFPWIADHVIGSNVVLTGTCYIEMMMETVDLPNATSPAVFLDLTIDRAAVLHNKDSLKMQVLPRGGGKLDVVTTTLEGTQTVHCTASLPVFPYSTRSHESVIHSVCLERGYSMLDFLSCPSFADLKDLLDRGGPAGRPFHSVDPVALYKSLLDTGYKFGPTFQLISHAWQGDEEMMFTVDLPTHLRHEGFRFHPVLFDACVHGGLLCCGSWSTAYLPTGADFLAIGAPLPLDCAMLVVHVRVVARDVDRAVLEFDVIGSPSGAQSNAWPLDSRLIIARGLNMSALVKTSRLPVVPKDVLMHMPLQSIIPFIDPQIASTAYGKALKDGADTQALFTLHQARDDLKLFVSCLAKLALAGPGPKTSDRFTRSVQRMAALTERVLSVKETKELYDSLLQRLPFFALELEITRTVGDHLPDILADQSVIADVIYRPDLLPKFFQESFIVDNMYRSTSTAVESIVAPLCAEGRVVRILEVGLRTGGLTLHLARKLQRWGDAGLIEYVATDLATTFFAEASGNVAEFPWVKVQRFNIEGDAAAQGLATAAFDVVVIFSTLHGVADIPTALAQIAGVVAPGGVVINIEPSNADYWWLKEMWFGAMDVWWRMADFRAEEAYYSQHGRSYGTCWMSRGEWVAQFQQASLFDDVAEMGQPTDTLLFVALIARRSRAPSPLWPRPVKAAPFVLLTAGETALNFTKVRAYVQGLGLVFSLCALPTAADNYCADPLQGALGQTLEGAATIVFYIGRLDLSATEVALCAYKAALHVVQRCGGESSNGNGSVIVFASENSCGPDASNPLGAALVGFARTVALEMDRSSVMFVDLDRGSAGGPTGDLVDYLRGAYPGEGEVIYRRGVGYVPRLHRLALPPSGEQDPSSEFAAHCIVESDGSGSIGGVRLCVLPPPPTPQAGEVVIAVDAAALNFKDVLMSLGLLSGLQSAQEDGNLGFGCVGRVLAVGSSARPATTPGAGPEASAAETAAGPLAVGDTVVALAGRCLASYTVCRADQAAVIKAEWDLPPTMLACILLYATAYEALVRRARLQAGEVVLIHSAASGVGQCAIQIAAQLGCVVYATVGTEAKADFLRQQAGVAHVSDSRDVAKFVKDVRQWSAGAGVDVVLNCLTGPAQLASLGLCRAGGRFVEIGKRDMLRSGLLLQAPLLHNVSVLSCQVDLQAADAPACTAPLLAEVIEWMRLGQFQPIVTEEVMLGQCGAAMQRTSRGTSISKVVVNVSASIAECTSSPLPLRRRPLDAGGAYLITGGTGGIGLTLGRCLAARGAGHVVLVGRSVSALSRRQRNEIAIIERLGARVHVLACDVADRGAVDGLVGVITRGLGLRLRAVMHLAASLADGLAMRLSDQDLDGPIRTKAVGAVNLHLATLGLPLDAFLVTTSTQDLGSMEQLPYVAANSICQQLMHMRVAAGLPGMTIALGAVVGAGMVERQPVVARMLALRGVEFLQVAEAAGAIAHAVCAPKSFPTYMIVGRIQAVLSSFEYETARNNTKWIHMKRRSAEASPASATDCLALARAKIAEIFCLSADDVDPAAPLLSLGVDSLVATELLTFFRTRLRIDISYTDILAGLSLGAIVEHAGQADA